MPTLTPSKLPNVHPENVDIPGISRPMTYAEPLDTPTEIARHDILDGWKRYHRFGADAVPGPTVQHQNIVFQIAEMLKKSKRALQTGKMVLVPCDVQISLTPLRTRQPDLLFISNERHRQQNRPDSSNACLSPAQCVWIGR